MADTDILKQLSKQLMGTDILSGGIVKFKKSISQLKELDTILTEISKSSNLTSKELEKLGNSAFDSASKYGKKVEDYLIAIQEMYRAGFSNAKQMAELSLLAQSATDLNATSAQNYLITTNAAYDLKGNIKALNNVLDSQNNITNHTSVNMQDMADAMAGTAETAAHYGIKIEELSALIATAATNTKNSGNEVGTALNSIFTNLQNTTNTSIIEAFDNAGISMTKLINGSEQLKTPIELLKELSNTYSSINKGSAKQTNLINTIGGNHADTLEAILNNWSSYKNMLDLYSQGTGSTIDEAIKNSNNWEGSLNQLGNSWTELIQTITNTDSLITGINALNSLASVAQKVSETVGVLPLAISAAYTAFSAKNSGGLIWLVYQQFSFPSYRRI